MPGESQQAVMLGRFHAIQPYLDDGVPLASIARERHITPRTIERWVVRYRSEGMAGLVRRERGDKGRHRLPDQLQQLIEGLALERPRRSIASIRRKACEVALREGWPQPGYKLVRSIIRDIDPALMSLAHDGTVGATDG